MRSILIFVVFCWCGNSIIAQDKQTPEKLLILKSGLSDFHVRDELASPLIYRGITYNGGIDFAIKSKKCIHIFELSSAYGYLTTQYKNYNAENVRAGFKYSYLHLFSKFNIFENNLTFYLGNSLCSFLNHSSYKENITEVGYLNATWSLYHSVGFSAFSSYKTNLGDFNMQFYFSFISNVSRPEYSYIPGTYTTEPVKIFGKMVMFWKNPFLQINFTYERNIVKFFNLYLQYNFQYTSYKEPRNIAMYIDNLLAGIFFSF